MSKPKTPSEIDRLNSKTNEPFFVPFSDKEGMAKASAALANIEPIYRATALNTWKDVLPQHTSVRDDFTKKDYEFFRPYETTPQRPKDIIMACMEMYQRIGVVKNVVDMMADFGSQGVNLLHRSEHIQKIYQEWFRRIEGVERTERFLNYLYRTGNVLVRRKVAKLKAKERKALLHAVAYTDMDVPPEHQANLEKNELPFGYSFLNPLTIDVMGEDMAQFIGPESYIFTLRLNDVLWRKIKGPKDIYEKDLLTKIPVKMLDQLNAGVKTVVLDRERVAAYYYKKDDWTVWANPMLYCIFDDISMLRKMKLADLAALDGAISHIRLWKLGSLEHKIYPTAAAVSHLADMLLNNVGGGSMDLIWGPELELKESSTDVYRFLGEAKYKPVMDAIYSGLGIPPTLTGAATGGGFTNNFISLRTLIERLKYGRDTVTKFWEHEIRLFQKAMGFRHPAEIVFDRMTLSDEAAELALLIQLADRDLISVEAIQERFGLVPDIEKLRQKRESKARQDKNTPPKASPFHNPQQDHELNKIALQSGQVAPSQVGMELPDKKDGEKTLLEHQADIQNQQTKLQMKQHAQESEQTNKENDHNMKMAKMQNTHEEMQVKHGIHPAQMQKLKMKQGMKGAPGQGRPQNSGDTTKRKSKVVRPRTSAEMIVWLDNVRSSYKAIADIIRPVYLKAKAKKNLRQLSDDEAGELERLNFVVLCNVDLTEPINKEVVKLTLAEFIGVPNYIDELVNVTAAKFTEKVDRPPTLEETRDFQASAVALSLIGDDDNVGNPCEA